MFGDLFMLLHTLCPLCFLIGFHGMCKPWLLHSDGELSCFAILNNILMGSYMFSFLTHMVSMIQITLFFFYH